MTGPSRESEDSVTTTIEPTQRSIKTEWLIAKLAEKYAPHVQDGRIVRAVDIAEVVETIAELLERWEDEVGSKPKAHAAWPLPPIPSPWQTPTVTYGGTPS